MNPEQRPPATAPEPAPGPHGDVEAALYEFRCSMGWEETPHEGIGMAFKAGAEWAALSVDDVEQEVMTFEQWTYTENAQSLIDMWDDVLSRSIVAKAIWCAAQRNMARSPEVQAVLDAARVWNACRATYEAQYAANHALIHAVMELERVEAARVVDRVYGDVPEPPEEAPDA